MAHYEPLTYPQGWQMCELPCPQDRPCVAKSNILLKVTLLVLNTADLKEYTLKHNPQSSPRCECRAHGMNGSGLICRKCRPPGYQATSWFYGSLARHGVSVWCTDYVPITRGTNMDSSEFETEVREGPSLGATDMGSTEGSGNRGLCCTGAPQGSAGQDPDSVSLAEMVSTLGFHKPKRSRCGASKRWAKRVKRAESLSGESDGSETRQSPGGQPHQEETFLTAGRGGAEPASGATGPSTSGDGGQPNNPGKRQRLSGGTPGGRQVRGPDRIGNLATPGLPRRVSGWPLCAKPIRRLRFLGKTLWTYRRLSARLWMGSHKRGSHRGCSMPTGPRGQRSWCARSGNL
jgi:hypothetical protein